MTTRSSRLKRLNVILIAAFALACFGLVGVQAWPEPGESGLQYRLVKGATAEAAEPAQRRRGGAKPAADEYEKGPATRFLHEHHSGDVPINSRTKKGPTKKLDCVMCHATTLEVQDTDKFPGPDLIKYPETIKLANTGTKINRLGFNKAHSACTECHKEIAPGSRQMCGMCHVNTATLKPFPNPNVELSQFADLYDHKGHKDYFDLYPDPKSVGKEEPAEKSGGSARAVPADHEEVAAAGSPYRLMFTRASAEVVPVAFTLEPQRRGPPPIKGLRCDECHNDAEKAAIRKMMPKHMECFACHANEKIVADSKKVTSTFYTNCIGCHGNVAENRPTVNPEIKAPKDPDHAIAIQIIQRSIVTPPPGKDPFGHGGSHKSFSPDEGPDKGKRFNRKDACVYCHTSAERAKSRMDMKVFGLRPKDPKLIQPPATACVACHYHADSMVAPATPVKLEQSKCLSCHTKEDAAKPVPESHKPFGAEPVAKAPEAKPETPKPTPKPETKPPAPKPETKPVAPKPETKPAPPKPETKPETKPEVKPETKPEAPKPEVKPETKPEAPKPEVKPEAPKPTQPVPAHDDKYAAYPKKNPDGSAPSKTQPTGKLMLGRTDDPIAKDIWGLSDKWGPAEFDHSTHVQPKYAENCEVCHHTNTDTKAEGALRCVACHRESGNEINPFTADGSEVDVQLAYHGNADNEENQAGCIACHKRKNAEPTSCAGCHSAKGAMIRPFRRHYGMVAAHDPWIWNAG